MRPYIMRSVLAVWVSRRAHTRAVPWLLLCVAMAACSKPEDPARVELRLRLKQPAQMSDAELGRLREEISRSLVDKKISIKSAEGTAELTTEQRATILGVLTEPAGMFDEELKQDPGGTVRVLNSAGLSLDSEIEASRRLWIDVETFLPTKFFFTYAFPGHGDYSYDLVVE